jgi:hypothetical protein
VTRFLTFEFSFVQQKWSETIQQTMNQQFEIEKEQLHNTAQGETDFWRARSAQFNMLHQQLQKPAVMRIRNVSEIWRTISKLNSNSSFLI